MKRLLRCLPVLLGLGLLGMASKPPVAVRFYAEANAQDTNRFASPVQLSHPARAAYIERYPTINERMIRAIYPFQAANGTWGCAFKLDQSGQLALEVLSTERRGSSVVAVLTTNAHGRQILDMLVDKPIHDGIISIPYGFSEVEIAVLTKVFPIMGQKKHK